MLGCDKGGVVVVMAHRRVLSGLGSQAVGQLLKWLLGPLGRSHLYMHRLIHTLTHSLTHSFIPLCNDLFTHSPPCSSIYSLIYSFVLKLLCIVHSLHHLSIFPFVYGLAELSIHLFIYLHSSMNWFTHFPIHLFIFLCIG